MKNSVFIGNRAPAQNLKLRRQLVGAAQAARSSTRFSAGDPLPTVSVLDLHGRATALDLRRQRTVILIVDPRCDSGVEDPQECFAVRWRTRRIDGFAPHDAATV